MLDLNENPQDLQHERQLWAAVASATIVDALEAVVNSKHPRAVAASAHARYFYGHDWAMICGFAELSVKPAAIERLLMTYKGNPTEIGLRRAFGIRADAPAELVAA